jgi:hypothetical protein
LSAPVLKSFAQRLYDAVAPLAQDDALYGYALANYCAALGELFQIVDDYGRDQIVSGELAPGWSQVLDLTRAPTVALPWLAQFVGVQLTAGLTDAQQRMQIASVGGWNRGTISAMVLAAQATLTGTKTVNFVERNTDAYTMTVITKSSETPNPVATLAALVSQKPAGIILLYQNIDGQSYGDLLVNAPLYSNAFSIYVDYQHLLFNNSGIPSSPSRNFGEGTFGSGTFGGP